MIKNQNDVEYYGFKQIAGAKSTSYTLDLNAGLTQVLADGTNTYLYGLGRIALTSTAFG